MPKKTTWIEKYSGIIFTLITVGITNAGTFAVMKYKLDDAQKQISILWEKKAANEFVADKLADVKISLIDHETRLRSVEQRRK